MGSAEDSAKQPRTLLEQLIHAREATYDEQVREFAKIANQLKEPATLSVRHLQRLAHGERTGDRAAPSTRRVMRQLYGYPFEDLVGPPDARPLAEPAPTGENDDRDHRLTAAAAHTSLDFANWAEADYMASVVVDHVSYELARIAVDYVSRPAQPLLRDLVALRDTLFRLLRERPNPRQSRELFFLAGTTCLLLAHASQNLGDASAAMAQARTAWVCADQADHNGLRAWVRGTQALIAEWSRRPAAALEFALAGERFAVTPESQIRLAAIAARTHARIGNAQAAAEAVQRLRRVQQLPDRHDDLADFGGLLTFPTAKQHYYLGGTYALIGHHSYAAAAALEAIDMYETGPAEQRSYGDEALARVDVSTSLLSEGDVDGAAAVLELVLALPPEQRIQQLHDGLARVQRTLVLPRYQRARAAIDLAAHLAEFAAPRVAEAREVESGR